MSEPKSADLMISFGDIMAVRDAQFRARVESLNSKSLKAYEDAIHEMETGASDIATYVNLLGETMKEKNELLKAESDFRRAYLESFLEKAYQDIQDIHASGETNIRLFNDRLKKIKEKFNL